MTVQGTLALKVRLVDEAAIRVMDRYVSQRTDGVRRFATCWLMLHDFLTSNRALLIERCRNMAMKRSEPKPTEHELAHGIPMFLDQLIKALTIEQESGRSRHLDALSAAEQASPEIRVMASLHGRDLLEQGFSLEQVVRDYGDVCQVVTQLAEQTGAPIEIQEFRTFNRCLDNAIAGAVSEYAYQNTLVSTEESYKAISAKLGPLAHELRSHLQVAMYALKAVKAGNVGIGGVTGAMLERNLTAMAHLIDRSLAEVRITSGLPPRLEVVRVAAFLGDVGAAAAAYPQARGCQFIQLPVDENIEMYVDAETLASAVGNLLQNAFKFTRPNTEVWLRGYVSGGLVRISVEDHCGGLSSGMSKNLMVPFVQNDADRSGLGLGLDICRRGAETNGGVLRVVDKPGIGCVFTIDLPCYPAGERIN